ncbi:MAG TPA: CoA transferase [Dehalococcoidia bacterium]|nr:CoA transferase [Dehalococcoidia bacterium]
MADLPLAGVRVADVTVVWAGPYVTQLLAEWGAEVIRVEPRTRIQPLTRGADTQPPPEETLRMLAQMGMTLFGFPDFDSGSDPWNRGSGFNSHGRNKLSMTADITTPEGREAFLKLIEQSDVLVENNVPETIEKAGITYEDLKQVNPRLIMLRMPAFGLSGPYKNYRALGTHIEGMIGHHYIRSYPDADPEAAGDVFTGDAVAGVMGAFAVTMALRHRDRTGAGQQIELSQAENFLPILGDFILDWTANGRDAGPQGNHHRTHAPHGYYPSEGDDNWIAIDCDSDEAWQTICDVLGVADLASDQRFTTEADRFEHRDVLDQLLPDATRKRDAFELSEQLQDRGVIAGPVQDEAAAFADPQLAHRGFFEELTSEATGTHKYPGLIFKAKNTPNKLRRPSPNLGQDNEYVYRELLGYDATAYEELIESGAVGADYPPGVVPWMTDQPQSD